MRTLTRQCSLVAIAESNLPKSLIRIARDIGVPKTLKLVELFGGTRLYVPVRPEKLPLTHPLLQAIGLDGARKLALLFRDCDAPCIPLASRYSLLMRNVAIQADSRRLNENKLARKYRLTARSVRRILANCREL